MSAKVLVGGVAKTHALASLGASQGIH